MGAKFTNVQVLCEGADAAAFHTRVVAAARERLARAGLRELAEDAAERPARTVVIGPPERWVAIYDQATEDLGHGNSPLAPGAAPTESGAHATRVRS